MAPELQPAACGEDGRTKVPYTKAVDIWAMGQILRNLLSTYPSKKQDGSRGGKDQDPFIELIEEMMSPIAESRPTAAQCLDSPWLRPEETFSKPIDKKRKASLDLANGRAKESRPGTRPPPNSTVE